MGKVECKSCYYTGPIEAFPAAMSVYQDIRCPICGSTANDHNSDYQNTLLENMKKSDNKKD